jgi:phosphopantothenoylcysteine decarboxylase/phosphopantothenate--cysteine ligase
VPRIVLGITGGIAAYKAAAIIRLLGELGHDVKVVPTQNALRFIGAATLEALSHNIVDPDLYTDVESVKHIRLAQEADLVIVAPASASFLARTAAGIADDLLGNTILATKAPVLIAPAMHTEMFLNDATQQNIATLSARGYKVLQPATGRLTGEDSGIGRLPEPEEIVTTALALLKPQDFSGKRFLVTAGGTQEPIDPVRFIGNRSSGKQGVAIALEAASRGAQVTLVGANIQPLNFLGVDFVAVETAAQMFSAVEERLVSFDYLVMAAAVGDFSSKVIADEKIKRSGPGSQLTIELIANPDILLSATARIAKDKLSVTTVGFAAETTEDSAQLRKLAAHKLMSKGCDLLVANDVSKGKVFGSDSNSVLILSKSGIEQAVDGTKDEVASVILDILGSL